MRERLARTGLRIVDAPSGAEIFVDGEAWGRAPRPDPIKLDAGNHTVELLLEGHEEFRAQVHVPAGETVDVPVEMKSLGSGRERSRVPLVLAAGGGAVVAAGIVVGGVGLAKAKDAPYSSGEAADSAHRLAVAADVMMAVGAAAVLGGGILWLVSRRNRDEPAPPAVSAAPFATRDVVGAQLGLRF